MNRAIVLPMTKQPVQLLLPFDQVTPEEISPAISARASGPQEPDDEVVMACEQLERWLIDPRTGKPATETGAEVLRAVEQALVCGRNSYFQAAEDLLATLALRNGATRGDDIPSGVSQGRPHFHEVLEELQGLLDDQFAARGREPAL